MHLVPGVWYGLLQRPTQPGTSAYGRLHKPLTQDHREQAALRGAGMSKAPNFDGEYPGAGEIIGPLWQRLWDHMEDGRWYNGPNISKELCGEASNHTARSVLSKAARHGVLQVRMRRMPRQRNVYCWYKRIDSDVKTDG